MSEANSTASVGTSTAADDRIDEICDQFEAAWKTGERPCIEDYLARGDASDRAVLLRELVILDLFWRKRAGEHPEPREYLESLPDKNDVTSIVDAFVHDARARPRFTKQAEPFARGGLGAVFRAYDEELHRVVALKTIRGERAHDPQSQARFLREAEITGQLEHPGIVTVYSLNRSDDGRHYYAMPFIRGDTLKDAIARYHAPDGAARDPDPGTTTLALRGLLGRLIDACNAVSYAHSRGVIHRDLKPDNIMLGPFGETLVLDWGLAKPLGASAEPGSPEPPITPSPSSGSSDTEPGKLLGTLRYMSPEQAAAEPAEVGPASDVYSLGATLYQILTGMPPFADEHEAAAIIAKVRAGTFALPHSVHSDIPRSLEAICLKAMALKPAERYTSAHALAADLEKWLAGEPVTAWREPVRLRARRWMKRHRTLVTTSAVGALIALVALGVFAVVLTGMNRRLARTNADLVAARAAAEKQRDQAKEVTRFLVSSFRKPDPEQDGKDVKLAEVLGRAVKDLRTRNVAPAARATILGAVAETHLSLGLLSEAVDNFAEALAIAKAYLGEAHPETLDLMVDLAAAYHEAGDLGRAVDLDERALKLYRATLGADHPDTLNAMSNLGLDYKDAGRLKDAAELLGDALEKRRLILGDDDHGTLTTMNNLGITYQDMGRLDDAISLLRRALERERSALGEDNPLTRKTLNNLSTAYIAKGRFKDAVRVHSELLAVQQSKLPNNHPDTIVTLNNLGAAYLVSGQFQQAISYLELARKAYEAKFGAGRFHPRTLATIINLSNAHLRINEPDRAIALIEPALKAQPAAASDHPYSLFLTNNLAIAYKDSGKLERATSLLQHVLDRRKATLGDGHPDTLNSMANLANAQFAAGRLNLAIPLFEQTITAQRSRQGDHHPDTLRSINSLCAVYASSSRPDCIIPLLEQVLTARRIGLGEEHLDTLTTRRALGDVYEKTQRFHAAESAYRSVIDVSGQGEPRVDGFYSDSLMMLGRCLIGVRNYGEAESVLRDCVRVKRNSQPDHWTTARAGSILGEALTARQSFQEAEELLLTAERSLAEKRDKIPPIERDLTLRDAIDRLIRLYDAWGKPAEAEKWRNRLQALHADAKFPTDPFAP
jgi:eukaryotic-like serine/threonine-protein kinase